MPRYQYACQECDSRFIIHHGMNETQTKCTVCGAKQLKKIPSLFSIKKDAPVKGREKVGNKVKESIEKARQELQEEKERISNREVE